MNRREMIQRVTTFMLAFMPGHHRAPVKDIAPPTFHPIFIEHLTTRPLDFTDDQVHGMKLSALLTNGQIAYCHMTWTDQQIDDATDVSELFSHLTENWIKSMMDLIDNGARRA